MEVFGTGAEQIHDAIDAASVKVGRQFAAGDGALMTTWNREVDDDELIQYISTGGQGESTMKLLLYFASGPEEEQFFARIKDRLASNPNLDADGGRI